MIKVGMTVHEVRDTVIDRMVNSLYPVGTKLPTARELALELGVHRNTVSKAYHLLSEMGLVSARRGRGTYVVAEVDQNWQPCLSEKLQADIGSVVMAARRLGIDEDDLRGVLDAKISNVYQYPQRAGLFVECNQSDLDAGVSEISSIVDIRVDGMLIDEMRDDPLAVRQKFSVVFTNLIHVKEVSDILEPSNRYMNGDCHIVGVYTQPDESALVEIAKFKPGSTVGIVVDSPEGARRFTNQISTFNPLELRVSLTHEDNELIQFAQNVDAIVCSRSREQQFARLNLDIPVVTLPFHISRQSALRMFDALMSYYPEGEARSLRPRRTAAISVEELTPMVHHSVANDE